MSDPKSELALLGRELGAFRWAQGPGGNVSIKAGDELWVKASGKRLTDVALEGGHVRVPLDVGRAALAGTKSAEEALFSGSPRPSLETYFHVLGPAVVVHTHALGALLLACTSGAPEGYSGPAFSEVPYVRPGRGLAVAVEGALDPNAKEAIVILRSHGLLVYAESAARAIAMTRELDEAVRARFPGLPSPEERHAAYASSASFPIVGGVARRIPNRRSLHSGTPRYLFPDAVVCASTILIDALKSPEEDTARALAEVGRAAVLVSEAGDRFVFAKNESQLEQSTELVTAHDWLEDILAPRGIANYLDESEPAALLNLPSEQYRIRLSSK